MIKLECKHCKRFMGEAELFVGELLCANSACRGTSQFKILTNNEQSMVKYKFANEPKSPKQREVLSDKIETEENNE